MNDSAVLTKLHPGGAMNAIRRSWRRVGECDASVCLRLNRVSHRSEVRRFFAGISRLGDGVLWYALIVVLSVTDGTQGMLAAAHMTAVGAVGLALYKWMKGTFVRPRSYMVVQHIRLGTPPLDVYSFPSGHTLHAVAFTIVAIAYYPVLAWALIPFSMLVALSRVILGLHYPTDVMAGASIGASLALISTLL